VTSDLVTDNTATPALFLIHTRSEKALVVSDWPSIPAGAGAGAGHNELPPVPQAFNPAAFFSRDAPPTAPLPGSSNDVEVFFLSNDGLVNRLCYVGEGGRWTQGGQPGEYDWPAGQPGLLWTQGNITKRVEDLGVSISVTEQFTLRGPFGDVVMCEPQPGPTQRFLVSGLVALALDHGVPVQRSNRQTTAACSGEEADECQLPRPRCMSSGDQVEVKYGDSWFRGILQAVEGEIAHVKCDVDASDVITLAPLDSVRPADIVVECPEADGEHLTEGLRTHSRSQSQC